MKDTREKVIFRKVYDPYMGIDKIMCIFPEDEANPGRICYVDIWKNGSAWYHDAYDEADKFYVNKQKIIHKNDPIIPELIDVLKGFYGGDYKPVEKIVRGMRCY